MSNIFYYNIEPNHNSYAFAKKLNTLIMEKKHEHQNIVYLCIGSDRSTGDSLGPLVGHKLSRYTSKSFSVYGTLKNPVHAINLSQYVEKINTIHRNPFIIAIDASLGMKTHIGCVTLSTQPLKPGLGVKKNLEEVGDISITGIVNFSGILDNLILQSTHLSLVMDIADYITKGIITNDYIYQKNLLQVL